MLLNNLQLYAQKHSVYIWGFKIFGVLLQKNKCVMKSVISGTGFDVVICYTIQNKTLYKQILIR